MKVRNFGYNRNRRPNIGNERPNQRRATETVSDVHLRCQSLMTPPVVVNWELAAQGLAEGLISFCSGVKK